MRVRPAEIVDLHPIHVAYAHTHRIQQAQGAAVWPQVSTASVRREIRSGLLMLVLEEDELVGVFSVTYEAPAIWATLGRGNHLYLDRIARSPTYHTRGLIDAVLTWARARCRELERAGVRLGTPGSNKPLIAFYERQGFALVGRRRIGAEPQLPVHYHGREFALLEETCRKPARRVSRTRRDAHIA